MACAASICDGLIARDERCRLAVRQMGEARRASTPPAFKKLDGFKGMTLLTERQTGKTIAVTFWESEDALRQSEEAVKDARSRAAESGGAGEPQVERFEVILDTMA
jgi:heme-degrading monooxygenase HmoA